MLREFPAQSSQGVINCDFYLLSEIHLSTAITKVIWLEKGNITNKALKHVLNSSKGSFRDALNMVDMLMIEITI